MADIVSSGFRRESQPPLQTGRSTRSDDALQRVETGNLVVVKFARSLSETIATYAAEPRESNFTPSGRSSPLGDTCR